MSSHRHPTRVIVPQTVGYRTLWLMLAVALLPLLSAIVAYFGGVGVPEQRLNHGQWVLEQSPLPSWQLRTAEGARWTGQGRWQLLQLAQRCDRACAEWQRLLPQLHKALGRDYDRVQLQRVTTDANTEAVEGMSLLRLPASGSAPIRDGVWLADPLGNLVLYYPFEQSTRELLQDLKRLLKVSKVG